jgi:hypothetical protein
MSRRDDIFASFSGCRDHELRHVLGHFVALSGTAWIVSTGSLMSQPSEILKPAPRNKPPEDSRLVLPHAEYATLQATLSVELRPVSTILFHLWSERVSRYRHPGSSFIGVTQSVQLIYPSRGPIQFQGMHDLQAHRSPGSPENEDKAQ